MLGTFQKQFYPKANIISVSNESLIDSLDEDEIILFMDSVHPTQETKISYGWIKKGVEKMIATVADRKSINLTGAIELNTLSILTNEYETINASGTIDFLEKILDKCFIFMMKHGIP